MEWNSFNILYLISPICSHQSIRMSTGKQNGISCTENAVIRMEFLNDLNKPPLQATGSAFRRGSKLFVETQSNSTNGIQSKHWPHRSKRGRILTEVVFSLYSADYGQQQLRGAAAGFYGGRLLHNPDHRKQADLTINGGGLCGSSTATEWLQCVFLHFGGRFHFPPSVVRSNDFLYSAHITVEH